MLHILICEDDPRHRARVEAVVNKQLETEDCEMELALSTDCPARALDYLEAHPDTNGLYFLDIDLGHGKMTGIELGAKIREINPTATIVFITTLEESQSLVFKHKIEAMDFIVKDGSEDVEERAAECMSLAYKRYLDTKTAKHKYFKVKAGERYWNVPYEDILFFETDTEVRNRMVLYTKNDILRFYGYPSKVEKLDPMFFRCNKGFVVNVQNVRTLNTATQEIEMINGEMIPVTVRKMSELKALMGQL